MTEQVPRTAADRCPGVFNTHAAADGALARIRLPGGRVRPDQFAVLAAVASAHGDGFLELTGRGNVQVRGITDVDAVADAITAVGLAPGADHDRIRNIEISPLTGRIGGLADVAPLAELLDTRMRGDQAPVGLSGRFLFGLDDGRGDVVRRGPDAAAIVRQHPGAGPGSSIVADILVGGDVVGSATGADRIVEALIMVASSLIEVSPAAWRVRDLAPAAAGRLRALVSGRLDEPLEATAPSPADPSPPIVGWFAQDDGAVLLGAVVELGRLSARLAEFIAAIDSPVIITPDREILIADLGEGVAETVVRVLAPMGLIFDADSPWARVSCCVGAPGCAKSLAPVRDDLTARVRSGKPITGREHWVGCGRGCGSPAGAHLRVEADERGYRSEPR